MGGLIHDIECYHTHVHTYTTRPYVVWQHVWYQVLRPPIRPCSGPRSPTILSNRSPSTSGHRRLSFVRSNESSRDQWMCRSNVALIHRSIERYAYLCVIVASTGEVVYQRSFCDCTVIQTPTGAPESAIDVGIDLDIYSTQTRVRWLID